MPASFRIAAATSALLLLDSCALFGPPGPPSGGPGTWPPTSSQCQRNNNVQFAWPTGSIGAELTRLHADPQCMSQPTCAGWDNQEQHQLQGASSGAEWLGPTSHLFTIAEQNTIVANARANAIAHTPPGKQFYRLTFTTDVIVAGGPSSGVIFATAYYGRCVADILDTHNPTGTEQQ